MKDWDVCVQCYISEVIYFSTSLLAGTLSCVTSEWC